MSDMFFRPISSAPPPQQSQASATAKAKDNQGPLPAARKRPDLAAGERVRLPAFGLPAAYWGRVEDPQSGVTDFKKFPLAIDGSWASRGVTLREQRMLGFMNNITDKPEWERKVFDDEIVKKYWKEAKAIRLPGNGEENTDVVVGVNGIDITASSEPSDDVMDTDSTDDEEMEAITDPGEQSDWETVDEHPQPDVYMSRKMFDFCIKELRDKAETFKKTGYVSVLDSEIAIVKSDSAVSEELKQTLRAAVRPLEDVPARLKDWHPGSDETVLDLVHPSLFPCIYGVTRALTDEIVPLDTCCQYIGKGTIVGEGDDALTFDEMSTRSLYHQETPGVQNPKLWGSYHWLPSEVELTEDGARITSYVNNLHPARHKDLYRALERLTTAAVPLFEECLSNFYPRMRIDLVNTSDKDFALPKGLKYRIPGREGPKALVNPLDSDDSDDSDNDWRWEDDYIDWFQEHRILIQREPRDYVPQDKLYETFANKKTDNFYQNQPKPTIRKEPIKLDKTMFPNGLQIIYKLANIQLTPEKPEYAGGVPHVEGALNDLVCATAIYYYDTQNISNSTLSFRQAIEPDEVHMIPDQSEFASLEQYLGVEQEGTAIQPLGSVDTREGRLIAFPNCAQHKVLPFRLADPTKPGHRKIAVMFLIDPHRPILSTANVPPQRRDWWADELVKQGLLSNLPGELFNQTIENVTFPLGWDEALEHREKLMNERGGVRDTFNDILEETTFFFCEH